MIWSIFKKTQTGAPPHKALSKRRSIGYSYINQNKEAKIPTADMCAHSYAMTYTERAMRQARPLSISSPHAKHYLRMLQINVVGHKGIILQGRIQNRKGGTDQKANNALEKAWKEWCKKGNIDVTGIYSFREILKQAVKCLARDGEFFLRIVKTKNTFKVQHLDSRLLATFMDSHGAGKNINMGVLLDDFGKPLGYYFKKPTQNPYEETAAEVMFIPADEIIHIYEIDFPHQNRGVSWFKPVAFSMHNTKEMSDATLEKARAASNIYKHLEYNSDYEGMSEDEEEEIESIHMDGIGIPVVPEGMTLKTSEANFPGNEYSPYTKNMGRSVAAGLGVSYNNLHSDAESINFSSIRDFTLKERDMWKDIQETIIENLCVPLFEKWLSFALLKGEIEGAKLTDLSRFKDVEFVPRRWEWIDPKKDADGAAAMVAMGAKSPAQVIRDTGNDPETVWTEYGQNIKTMEEAGISPEYIQFALFGASQKAEQSQDNKEA